MKPFADHFSRLATEYATARPSYPDELFSYLATLTAHHELAWDCAAGSGQASLPLTRAFHRVVATDASGAMLEQAPRHPRVEYRVAEAEQSGLEAESVDLVTVAQALHWLELDLFYGEVERVLRPGGVMAVWSYNLNLLDDEAMDQRIRWFYTDVVGPYWPPERRYVETGYRTLPFPYPELKHPEFVMERRWTCGELLSYIGTWSATQRFREQTGHDPVSDLQREITPLWGNPAARRRVRWPLSLRVGRRPA